MEEIDKILEDAKIDGAILIAKYNLELAENVLDAYKKADYGEVAILSQHCEVLLRKNELKDLQIEKLTKQLNK